MTTAKKPRVPRGPNAERRAATRAKIMEATVRCLAEFGYAATSTPLVARLAKVSRGSLLHQFPTKIDLMIRAAQYPADALRQFQELKPIPTGPAGSSTAWTRSGPRCTRPPPSRSWK